MWYLYRMKAKQKTRKLIRIRPEDDALIRAIQTTWKQRTGIEVGPSQVVRMGILLLARKDKVGI